MSVNYEKMTVVELRKWAKEQGIKLSSGLSKQGIIDRLEEHDSAQQKQDIEETAVQTVMAPVAAPVNRAVRTASIITDDEGEDSDDTPVLTVASPIRPARTQPVSRVAASGEKEKPSSLSSISSKAPAFTLEGSKSWHNPRAYQPSYSSRSSYTASSRPYGGEKPQGDKPYSARTYAPAPRADYSGYSSQSPAGNRFGPDIPEPGREMSRPAYAAESHAGPQMPYHGEIRSAEPAPAVPNGEAFHAEPAPPSPTVSEMLATGECGDSSGILEIHPDGYGFLRTETLSPGKKDVYVSNAQIRRFNLRSGDYVTGKTRPQREGDRYSALLYITLVNGSAPEENSQRPCFESLTPVYPRRQIRFSQALPENPTLKAIDLFCPIGYGQRAALVLPSRMNENEVLTAMAQAVSTLDPEAELIHLLIDARPEDVTGYKDLDRGEVIYTTVESTAENHLHTAELCFERAMRLVEQKKNVIVFLDSLTRLGRALNALAPASARSLGGGLAAGCAYRGRKLFGAARNLREGGSLTVIAILNATGNPLDEAIQDEFYGVGNMCLTLKKSRDGSFFLPDLALSMTRKSELMLSEQEKSVADQLRKQIQSSEDPDAFLEEFLSSGH